MAACVTLIMRNLLVSSCYLLLCFVTSDIVVSWRVPYYSLWTDSQAKSMHSSHWSFAAPFFQGISQNFFTLALSQNNIPLRRSPGWTPLSSRSLSLDDILHPSFREAFSRQKLKKYILSVTEVCVKIVLILCHPVALVTMCLKIVNRKGVLDIEKKKLQ